MKSNRSECGITGEFLEKMCWFGRIKTEKQKNCSDGNNDYGEKTELRKWLRAVERLRREVRRERVNWRRRNILEENVSLNPGRK